MQKSLREALIQKLQLNHLDLNLKAQMCFSQTLKTRLQKFSSQGLKRIWMKLTLRQGFAFKLIRIKLWEKTFWN